jgi:hypothetical protein
MQSPEETETAYKFFSRFIWFSNIKAVVNYGQFGIAMPKPGA